MNEHKELAISQRLTTVAKTNVLKLCALGAKVTLLFSKIQHWRIFSNI